MSEILVNGSSFPNAKMTWWNTGEDRKPVIGCSVSLQNNVLTVRYDEDGETYVYTGSGPCPKVWTLTCNNVALAVVNGLEYEDILTGQWASDSTIGGWEIDLGEPAQRALQ